MNQLCITGKTGYGRKEAQGVLKHMKRSRHVTKKPQRVYFCPDCKQWHVTSRINGKPWK